MLRFFLSTVFTAGVILLAVAADPKPGKIAINEPTKLKDDADFAIQGEYEGSHGDMKYGVQVVAKGGGKFTLKALGGGLPGAGWDGQTEFAGTGETKDGKTTFTIPDVNVTGTLTDGVATADVAGNTVTLKKVTRSSPTVGAKPPEGAVVLFGGADDVNKWENGKLVELSDGKFLAANNVRSKQTFTNFTAHVEFRLAWMPNSSGQGRSNSGVYVQDRYEVQVLDSFGLKGVDNECGGIYKESSPKVNMCLPPMVWQTYDIDFTAAEFADGKKTKPAKITVKHNGVVIHDGLELKANTPGGKFNKEVNEPGALFFQNHGDPVVFRNVWVVEKK
jgi:Domain of Unknown Function (DUF1080)